MATRIIHGDCRDVLPTLPANSVHMVCTSPPYFGLRDYGVAGQIGLEASPADYIATMIEVFREVRRVLRDDGTLWLNVGDSYALGVGMARGQPYQRHALQKSGLWAGTPKAKRDIGNNGVIHDGAGLKPKDLMMMPARLALALQADGWWLRSDIIWAKPNPMPESVTDRPTSAHEHVFLLAKSPRYFFDAEAVAEESIRAGDIPGGRGSYIDINIGAYKNGLAAAGQKPVPPTRNIRNVWTIATEPFSDAHFATFPTALVERCIKAGTSERGCCVQCGKQWYRIVERNGILPDGTRRIYAGNRMPDHRTNDQGTNRYRDGHIPGYRDDVTIGWHPTCACDKPGPPQPCTVLDPFAGAGTTLLVAERLQRHGIGIELSPAYASMARNRIVDDAPLLAQMAADD